LGVVRTLYERSDNIVTDLDDQKEEIAHIDQALKRCGYPSWSFKQVRKKLEMKDHGEKNKRNEKGESQTKTMVAMPSLRRHGVCCDSHETTQDPETAPCTPQG
jgi:hypothetical protein